MKQVILLLITAIAFTTISCGKKKHRSVTKEDLERMQSQLSEEKKPASFKEKCEANDYRACVNYGIALKYGRKDLPKDLNQARVYFKKACDAGTQNGCWYLSRLVAREDQSGANQLALSACEKEYANSCVDIGFAYVHGKGVNKDLKQALTYFKRACKLGTGCAHVQYYEKLAQSSQ